MNYLAHGWRFVDQPYFLAGTAAPDWMSVIDRRNRLRSKAAERFVEDSDPQLAALARGVVHHEVLPARSAEYAPIPDWVDERIRAGLRARGIDALYTHQAEAIDHVRAGRDVTIVTPTASGKTLCYSIPILQTVAEDPAARALLLFPTKALGQDQVAEFGAFASAAALTVAAATYDGDTPAPIRSAIRTAGQVVVTNPNTYQGGAIALAPPRREFV